MKKTQYFEYTRKRPDRAQIKEDWIKTVIEKPEKIEIQSDGRIRKWARISEVGKHLRVILLEDGETVHNAFIDRSYIDRSYKEE
ncbi:MAG: hypothetical protein KGY70_14360 [Bacteroidales bacterium]|nr:hypothetical protein [Bacteroidales bacterium]